MSDRRRNITLFAGCGTTEVLGRFLFRIHRRPMLFFGEKEKVKYIRVFVDEMYLGRAECLTVDSRKVRGSRNIEIILTG